jgi:hypothetical protein
LFLVKEE